jgi:oxygen-independent coproporphyrinogen III oxidase
LAGIYIHIPFCKQACNYCDFHFSTSFKTKDDMLTAMILELNQRKNYLASDEIKSIYLGGGTPSVLDISFIEKIITTIHSLFSISPNVEITLEANPDDLSLEKLKDYRSIGINRLSIGIQSFDDKILRYLNRIHSSQKAVESIELAQKAGFDNISIDLMYGVPTTDLYYWENQLNIFKKLKVAHLSSYCMTIEPKTVFGNYLKNKKIDPIDEETAIAQFEFLMNFCSDSGYDQYEISNFCKDSLYSIHNSGYWLGEKYLGIGPGAHSYNKNERSYNISNNNIYIYKVINNDVFFENEYLTKENILDEYVMTSLRTKWGCNIKYINDTFDYDITKKPFFIEFVKKGLLNVNNNKIITLSTKGKFIADSIILEIIYNNGI